MAAIHSVESICCNCLDILSVDGATEQGRCLGITMTQTLEGQFVEVPHYLTPNTTLTDALVSTFGKGVRYYLSDPNLRMCSHCASYVLLSCNYRVAYVQRCRTAPWFLMTGKKWRVDVADTETGEYEDDGSSDSSNSSDEDEENNGKTYLDCRNKETVTTTQDDRVEIPCTSAQAIQEASAMRKESVERNEGVQPEWETSATVPTPDFDCDVAVTKHSNGSRAAVVDETAHNVSHNSVESLPEPSSIVNNVEESAVQIRELIDGFSKLDTNYDSHRQCNSNVEPAAGTVTVTETARRSESPLPKSTSSSSIETLPISDKEECASGAETDMSCEMMRNQHLLQSTPSTEPMSMNADAESEDFSEPEPYAFDTLGFIRNHFNGGDAKPTTAGIKFDQRSNSSMARKASSFFNSRRGTKPREGLIPPWLDNETTYESATSEELTAIRKMPILQSMLMNRAELLKVQPQVGNDTRKTPLKVDDGENANIAGTTPSTSNKERTPERTPAKSKGKKRKKTRTAMRANDNSATSHSSEDEAILQNVGSGRKRKRGRNRNGNVAQRLLSIDTPDTPVPTCKRGIPRNLSSSFNECSDTTSHDTVKRSRGRPRKIFSRTQSPHTTTESGCSDANDSSTTTTRSLRSSGSTPYKEAIQRSIRDNQYEREQSMEATTSGSTPSTSNLVDNNAEQSIIPSALPAVVEEPEDVSESFKISDAIVDQILKAFDFDAHRKQPTVNTTNVDQSSVSAKSHTQVPVQTDKKTKKKSNQVEPTTSKNPKHVGVKKMISAILPEDPDSEDEVAQNSKPKLRVYISDEDDFEVEKPPKVNSSGSSSCQTRCIPTMNPRTEKKEMTGDRTKTVKKPKPDKKIETQKEDNSNVGGVTSEVQSPVNQEQEKEQKKVVIADISDSNSDVEIVEEYLVSPPARLTRASQRQYFAALAAAIRDDGSDTN